MTEFEVTAAIGGAAIAVLLGVMVWLRRHRRLNGRHFSSFPVLEVADLRERAQVGLLRLCPEAEAVEGPLGHAAAAVTVTTWASGYKGALSIVHVEPHIGAWRVEGVAVRLAGKTRVISESVDSASRVEHDRLELPAHLAPRGGSYHLVERRVGLDEPLCVLGRHAVDDEGVNVEPLVEGGFVFLLADPASTVGAHLVNPGLKTGLDVRVDLRDLVAALVVHREASFIKRSVG